MKAVREGWFVQVVKTLWFDVVEKAYVGNKRSLLEKWRETGCWYGKYFATKKMENSIVEFRDFICNLMWGASEFSMELNVDGGKIRCVSADFPESYTELLSVFLEGALDALGYQCIEKDISKGLIRIVFKKQ